MPARLVGHDGPVVSRAVTVQAQPHVVFRWVCQLRVAPYSYDLLDNLGRRSPRSLTPGLERLELGQRFASIFTLVDWVPHEMVALEITEPAGIRLFGRLPLVYQTVPLANGPTEGVGARTTLRGDIALPRPRSALARTRSTALAWGDLVMMRRQLLTLARLSEQTARSTRSS
ncbi:SRPBCC family protein [Terrabacter sp. C0L_2]|uniref:SRPBCC family protein n=1 Tax=Terrabacter sp. C0L_2 TaxID=3108389 RepID=UPI002ED2156F|nr:SRPBCC family protein [Terrabacter sp. C0L_2]